MVMFVTQKHHRRVVAVLLGALLLVFIFLILVLLKANFFGEQGSLLAQKFGITLMPNSSQIPLNSFLQEEEAVIVKPKTKDGKEEVIPIKKVLFKYIEVTDGCGPHFTGDCVNVRSGPGTDYLVIAHLRNGMVLKVSGKVERDGYVWYKVAFDEWLRYPERVKSDWYVAADYVKVLFDEGDRFWDGQKISTSTKQIIVNRKTQTLYAYEGDVLFMMEKISTGLELTPTPAGTFTVFKKTPSRYMQGPLPGVSGQYYDLPGVPWNLYFTHGGAVIHGAYWHDSFGRKYSHGCVNLPPDKARKLYDWADLGMKVTVEDW